MASDRRDHEIPHSRGRFPNLLIIGAAKSGTSSLFEYLGQHPDVFMSPIKEPRFFSWEGREKVMQGPGAKQALDCIVDDVDEYKGLFEEARDEKVLVEASPDYLYYSQAPERIRHHVPEAKLIAILRNPIDRAYSAFLHATRERRDPLSDFRQALAEEPARIRDGWGYATHYTAVGMYAQELERYKALFPATQMRIYLYDDLARDRVAVVRDAFRFLGIDPTFEADVERKFNQGKRVRSSRIHVLIHSRGLRALGRHLVPPRYRRKLDFNLRRMNRLPVESMSPEVRESLARLFEPEIIELSQMLGRDLSPWLHNRTVAVPEIGISIGMQTNGLESASV